MAKPSVGYIGLGNAGYPMAACLAKKGYKLLVHDSNDTTARNFVTEFPDCRMASRADGTLGREVFSECEIAITMLPDGKIVREALLGENGIAWGLKPGILLPLDINIEMWRVPKVYVLVLADTILTGSIVVDISSSSPFDTQSLGRELEDLSITLIDSPITQRALHSIDTGGATLMVGSNDAAALGRALPVLQDMSSHVFSMGVLGAGHTMKTLNNYVSVGSIIALCDALVRRIRLEWTYISIVSTSHEVFFLIRS